MAASTVYVRNVPAAKRVLAKLPKTAAELTPPERRVLKDLEAQDAIQYVEQSGIWVVIGSPTEIELQKYGESDVVDTK